MTTKSTIERFLDAVTKKTDWETYLAQDLVFIIATSPLKRNDGKEISLPA